MKIKTLSIAAQWLVVLAFLGFAGWALFRPTPPPLRSPDTWRHWHGFHILSFAGVARDDADPTYPSAERLAEQLQALRDAGYHAIMPDDALAFLESRAPLPERAVMLVFEGGRKEALIRAAPLLQRLGFTAVLAMPTSLVGDWSGFYVRPGDIRRIARQPHWAIASMGHAAFREQPGHFLTTRQRGADGSPEASAAFEARVLNDYHTSATKLTRWAGSTPLLYLYPFADTGTGPEADVLAAAVNRRGVTEHYLLAVARADQSFNGAGRDPLALTRLRVRGDWSGAQLVAELERDRPALRAITEPLAAADWRGDPYATVADGALYLPAGATLWRRGTDNWTGGDITATLERAPDGIAALYAHYTGPQGYVRVVVEPGGLRVQERLAERLQTLAWLPRTNQPATRLALKLRANRLWLAVDDGDWTGPLPLAAATWRGRIGFGSERGESRVSAFSAAAQPSRWVMLNGLSALTPEQRQRMTAWLPTWFAGDPPYEIGEVARVEWAQAAAAGVETIPVIAGAAGLDATAAEARRRGIEAALSAAGLLPAVRAFALDGLSPALAAQLRERGARIVHILDAARVGEMTGELTDTHSTDRVLLRGDPAQATTAMQRLLARFPAQRLLAPLPSSAPDLPGIWLTTAEEIQKEREP